MKKLEKFQVDRFNRLGVTQSETLTVYKGVENRVYSPVQDGREPLYSNNGVSPMLSGRIDPFSTPLYNGRNKLFPPSSRGNCYY